MCVVLEKLTFPSDKVHTKNLVVIDFHSNPSTKFQVLETRDGSI